MLRYIILGASALAIGLGAGWVFVAGGSLPDRTGTELPINIAKPAPPQQSRGHLVRISVSIGGQPSDKRKGWIGINMASLELPLARLVGLPNADGVVILDTIEGGPASQVGLRFGDILLAVNTEAVANINDVRQHLMALTPGSETVLEVWRVGSDTNNDAELLRMLLRQADGGDPNVMYSLGRLYEIGGRGLARNAGSAVEWYRKGAAAGGRNAKAALAFALLDGRGTASDLSEGLRLLKEAAANDQPNAMNRLGHLLLEGRITEKNPSEAARMFTKAAEVGHVPSMVDLGKLYATGTGVSKDPANAAVWFKQAVRHNDGNGMVQLGWLYEHGAGIETDLEAAAELYRRAATLRNAGGMVNLALLYSQGRGVGKNDAAAVSLYRDAVTLGHPMALNNLAWMLQQGRGVERADPEQAADLMMKSLGRHNEFSRIRMTQFSGTWTKEFRRALQKKLTDAGFYKGPIEGDFDYLTVKAINAYFNGARGA